MQASLNFSDNIRDTLEFLKKFPRLETKSSHELLRCKIGEATVTMFKSGKLLVQGKGFEKAKGIILKGLEKKEKAIIGIDETGRGESFAPFVVAGVLAKASSMREMRDSKKTGSIEKAFKQAEKNAQGIAVFSISAKELFELHEKGKNLNQIEAIAIAEMVSFFRKHEKNAKAIVDGNPIKECPAGIQFLPKGDDLNPVIGAASVVAKYYRDHSKDREKRKNWGNW